MFLHIGGSISLLRGCIRAPDFGKTGSTGGCHGWRPQEPGRRAHIGKLQGESKERGVYCDPLKTHDKNVVVNSFLWLYYNKNKNSQADSSLYEGYVRPVRVQIKVVYQVYKASARSPIGNGPGLLHCP